MVTLTIGTRSQKSVDIHSNPLLYPEASDFCSQKKDPRACLRVLTWHQKIHATKLVETKIGLTFQNISLL